MRLFIVLSFMIFLIPGCYTQFATMESTLPSTEPTTMIDSTTGDTVKVIRQVDTIVSRERETCVWVRDMFGHPYLQCYDSYYPRAWFSYSNTPWWYRNDPYWYDYNRCPRYYRYDPSCGRCRYDDDYRYDNYYRGGGRHYDDRHYDNNHGSSYNSGSSSSGSNNGPTPSGGAPITGSSSRTTAQKAPPPPPPSTPSGGSPQKAMEQSPPPPQQPASPPPSQNDQNNSKPRNIRPSRSR